MNGISVTCFHERPLAAILGAADVEMNDQEVLLVLGPAVLLLAIGCELIWRNRYVDQWVARKVLHIGAIGACALVPMLLDDLRTLIGIVIISELLLIGLVWKGYLFDQEDGGRSWGIMLFPLPYLFLLFVEDDRWLISLPMCILAFSDAFAAIAGNTFKRGRYTLTNDPKSFIGSVVFFLVTLIVFQLFPSFRGAIAGVDTWQAFVLLISITGMITLLEAIGSRGWDNVLIPLSAWLLLHHITEYPGSLEKIAFQESALLVASVLFIPMVVRLQWLQMSGAVAAALVASWVVFFAGIEWLLPLILFLVLSSIIGGFTHRARTIRGDLKSGKPRDAMQVLCNGGVLAICAAVFAPDRAALAMGISIAISAADTWASEIGTARRSVTRDILNWRKVPVGLSGGVSLPGTAGALAGALVFGAIGAVMIDSDDLFWDHFGLIIIGGMLGMFVDSVLGSSLQERYRTTNGEATDRPQGERISGLPWMTNDLVNLFSNAIATGSVMFLMDRTW